MKNILITGGGGFIGSHLVSQLLLRRTHNIIVCDTFGSDDKWRNLGRHPVHEIITPDAMMGWLDSHRQTLEVVYHLGSISSTTEKNIDLILSQNFNFSVKLWNWCNEHQMRLIYASAAATYGDGSQGFEDSMELDYLMKLRPLSGYGWSKHLFDVHVARAMAQGAVKLPQWAGLKFFNTYGPNEYHKGEQQSVITKIAAHAIQAGRVNLFRSYNKQYRDGEQQRDVIYVKDIAKVLIWLLDNPQVSGLFNIGTGTPSTFNQMAEAIFAALGRKTNIHYVDMPPSLAAHYQYYTQANMSRLLEAGYNGGFMSLQDGIRDYVQNYLLKDDRYL